MPLLCVAMLAVLVWLAWPSQSGPEAFTALRKQATQAYAEGRPELRAAEGRPPQRTSDEPQPIRKGARLQLASRDLEFSSAAIEKTSAGQIASDWEAAVIAKIDKAASAVEAAAPTLSLPKPEPTMDEVCEALAESAQQSGIPVSFFARLIWQESKFRADAVSPAGAQGMAQFMPEVAAALGLSDPFDPLQALPHSAQLLRMLHQMFGNIGLAAAAYNAGPKRVIDWLARRSKLPAETRNYVHNITGQPPEKWIVQKPIEIAAHLPRSAPCRGVAGLTATRTTHKVSVELDDSIARIIQEAKAREAAEATARKRALAAAKAHAKSQAVRSNAGGAGQAKTDPADKTEMKASGKDRPT